MANKQRRLNVTEHGNACIHFVSTPPVYLGCRRSSHTVCNTNFTTSPVGFHQQWQAALKRDNCICMRHIYISLDALWICMCGISVGHCMPTRTIHQRHSEGGRTVFKQLCLLRVYYSGSQTHGGRWDRIKRAGLGPFVCVCVCARARWS